MPEDLKWLYRQQIYPYNDIEDTAFDEQAERFFQEEMVTSEDQ